MTRAEWREGFVRLAVVAAAVLVVVVAVALALHGTGGGSFRAALATSFGIVALVPLVGGVGVFFSAGPVARDGAPWRTDARLRVVGREERREKERLAAGLIAVGTILFALALTVA